jgi:hypothetical protein
VLVAAVLAVKVADLDLLLEGRVQLASAVLEELAVCEGPAAAKPSAWAPTRDLYSALTAGRDTTT